MIKTTFIQVNVSRARAGYLTKHLNTLSKSTLCMRILLHKENSLSQWKLCRTVSRYDCIPTRQGFETEEFTFRFLLFKMGNLHVSHNLLAQFKCKNNSDEVKSVT